MLGESGHIGFLIDTKNFVEDCQMNNDTCLFQCYSIKKFKDDNGHSKFGFYLKKNLNQETLIPQNIYEKKFMHLPSINM